MSPWIKMRTNLGTDECVVKLSGLLGLPEQHIVGCLHAIWSWFDQETIDGSVTLLKRFCNADVTLGFSEGRSRARLLEHLDRLAGVQDFTAALQQVGWLEVSEERIAIPDFEKHMSQTAKRRALTAGRVKVHRSKDGAKDVTLLKRKCNAASVTKALPEEEEEEEYTSLSSLSPKTEATSPKQQTGESAGKGNSSDVFSGKITGDCGDAEAGYWQLSESERAQIDASLERLTGGKPFITKSPDFRRKLAQAIEQVGHSTMIQALEWAAGQTGNKRSPAAAMAHARTLAGRAGFDGAKGCENDGGGF